MRYLYILSFWSDLGKELGNLALKILFLPFTMIFLLLDGVVYTLVAYSYKLFELMARMNFASIQMWLGPVISRVQALLIVFILFMVGYTLIQYLVNPESVGNGATGVALLKNIAIAAILLISYNTIFTLLNEFTFVMIGAPDNYSYDILDEWFGVKNEGEPGLVANLVLGPSSEDEETQDFGKSLAISTLSIFLHSKGFSRTTDRVEKNPILAKIYSDAMEPNNDTALLQLPAAALQINFIGDNDTKDETPEHLSSNIEYKYPLLSTAVGAYLVYTLVTIALELGVRAFKLIILQILAPIAIVTIIKDGWKGKTFQGYLKSLGGVYISIFIRVASMYFVTALISVAWTNIGDLYDDAHQSSGFTQFLLLIIIVIAGYRVAKMLPQFIDETLGTKLSNGQDGKGGFGNFLRGALGGAVGGMAGVSAGIAASRANGLSGAAGAFNALRSGFQGARTGVNNRGNNIADALRNARTTAQNARNGARGYAETMRQRGGNLRSNIGYGLREATGRNYLGSIREQNAINAENTSYETTQRTHQANVDAATRAHTTAQQGITQRRETENASYATTQQGITQRRDAETRRTRMTMDSYDTSIANFQQANATLQTEMASEASTFTYAGGSETIAFGSSADTFAQTVADNDSSYLAFKESAEVARAQAAAATSDADRARFITEANQLQQEADSYHRAAETSARQVFEQRRQDKGITSNEATIRQMQQEKSDETRRHQKEMETITQDERAAQSAHQAAMDVISNDERTEQASHQATMDRLNQEAENARTTHEATVRQHTDRLEHRYGGSRQGGNH